MNEGCTDSTTSLEPETELLLQGRTVASLSPTAPPRLREDRPLSLIADQIASSPGFDIYPVVAAGDDAHGEAAGRVGRDTVREERIVGALHLPDVLEMDPTDRNFRTAGEVMRPIERIPSIHAGEDLEVLLRRIDDEQVLKVVDEDGRVTSLISRQQVMAALDRLHALVQEQRGKRRGLRTSR